MYICIGWGRTQHSAKSLKFGMCSECNLRHDLSVALVKANRSKKVN